ncbi:MAG: hypothetical protein WC492_03355 [Candidatus Micrarchaeia archaeon]
MVGDEKMPASLQDAQTKTGPQCVVNRGIVHITYRQRPLYAKVGGIEFSLDDAPAIIIGRRKIRAFGVF